MPARGRIDIGFNWLFGLGMLLPSLAGGLFLMWPLAWLFDTLEWSTFNSWALVHGSFVFVWPLLSFVAFLLLMLAIRLVRLMLARLKRPTP